jgi:hypothetical protein
MLNQVDMWINDTMQCPKVYLVAVGSALVLIWLWNVFLRSFAEVLAWISIFVVGVGLVAVGFLIRNYNIANYPEGTESATSKWLNIASITFWVLSGIYFLAVLCCWYSIKIAIKVLRVAARVIMTNMRMVIIPIF